MNVTGNSQLETIRLQCSSCFGTTCYTIATHKRNDKIVGHYWRCADCGKVWKICENSEKSNEEDIL